MDGLTMELLRGGGETIVKAIIVCLCHKNWKGRHTVLEDWIKLTVVPICKRREDTEDCKNYGGIKLQSIPEKT